MRNTLSALVVALIVAGAASLVSAQAQGAAERFGIGTFSVQGRTFTGLVLRMPMEPLQNGGFVVDLAAAAKASNQQVPTDILAIINQYDSGVGNRIKAIVKDVVGRLNANRPSYVYDYKAVDVLMPYEPRTALYGRSNYSAHAAEMAARSGQAVKKDAPPPSMPLLWERASGDTRQNPYLFLIPPVAFTGDGDPIVVPPKRTRIDYECEFVGVVGKRAKRVPVNQASEYIFGYTQSNDVSDRQSRQPDPTGGDWWAQKGHDTYKPWGPYIVPREFVDPRNVPIRFTLNGQMLQDDNTKNADHSMFEYLAYASNVQTLRPGDVIAMGTPPGVGTARKPPVYMKSGDTAVCSHGGFGALTNPVTAEAASATARR